MLKFYGEYGTKDINTDEDHDMTQKNAWVKDIDTEIFNKINKNADEFISAFFLDKFRVKK